MTDIVPDASPIRLKTLLRNAVEEHTYGTLFIHGDKESGALHFVDGRLIHGPDQDEQPDVLLARLLTNTSGSCEFGLLVNVPSAHMAPSATVRDTLYNAVRIMAADAAAAGGQRFAVWEGPTTSPLIAAQQDTEQDRRKAEAERLRTEFFQRRNRRITWNQTGAVGIPPAHPGSGGTRPLPDASLQAPVPPSEPHARPEPRIPAAAAPEADPRLSTQRAQTVSGPYEGQERRSSRQAAAPAPVPSLPPAEAAALAAAFAPAPPPPASSSTSTAPLYAPSAVATPSHTEAAETPAEEAPTRRTALRSLIRNLVS